MNTGKWVSIAGLGILAATMAPGAGRHAEVVPTDGWIVADFVAAAGPATVTGCSEDATGAAQLVFERISGNADGPLAVRTAGREIVDFEWNPATGELTYRTTAATRIFNDLEQVAALGPNYPRCESR